MPTRYNQNRSRNDNAPQVNINLMTGGQISPANTFGFGVSTNAPTNRYGYANMGLPATNQAQPSQDFGTSPLPSAPFIPGIPVTQNMPIPTVTVPKVRVPQPEFY